MLVLLLAIVWVYVAVLLLRTPRRRVLSYDMDRWKSQLNQIARLSRSYGVPLQGDPPALLTGHVRIVSSTVPLVPAPASAERPTAPVPPTVPAPASGESLDGWKQPARSGAEHPAAA
jgi:hypothetical protein